MLCKAGGLSKRQLGAIRILDQETHVEIDADSIEDFLAHVGEGGRLEKSIRVTRLDGPPPARAPGPNRAQRREAAFGEQKGERARPRAKPAAPRPKRAKQKPGA